MKCRTVIWGSVATFGIILVAAGITLTQVGPGIVEDLVHEKLSLFDRKSDGYKYFIKPPIPVKANFTFFEVTNPDEVSAGGIPNLKEKGPYVFTEYREKKNLAWNGTDSIKFGQYKKYTFLKELSCTGCEEDDHVNIINMPLLSLIGKLNRMGYSGGGGLRSMAGALAQDPPFEGMGFEGLVMTVSVREFLFDGIKIGSTGWMIGLKSDGTQEDVTAITARLPITVFDPKNGFALFNHKNDTMENEWYEVDTEDRGWDRHTMITKWGQQNELDTETSENNMLTNLLDAKAVQWQYGGESWWGRQADVEGNTGGNNTCNILKGTDGNQFPPGVSKENPLWIFNNAPCRSIFVEHTQEVDVEGIPTLEFAVPKDGANINKAINVCSCEPLAKYNKGHRYNTNTSCITRSPPDSDTLDLSECGPEVTENDYYKCIDGIQDLYHCQGAATTLSYPHFYLAEEQANYFTGLNPDPEKHRLYLNVEPHTGMTLKLHSRIQLNVPLINSANLEVPIPLLENVRDIPNFPVLWIDLGADVESDPNLVEKLISELVTPVRILEIGQWAAIGVGAGLVVAALVFSVLRVLRVI